MLPIPCPSRPLILTCGLSCLLAAPVLAQTPKAPTATANSAGNRVSAPKPAPSAAPATNPARANTRAPQEQGVPVWVTGAAILGSLLGLAGTGLATHLLLGKRKLEAEVRGLNKEIVSLKNVSNQSDSIPHQVSASVADLLCSSLDYKQYQLSTEYRADRNIEFAVRSALESLNQDIRPKLNHLEESDGELHNFLNKLSSYIESHNKRIDGRISETENRSAQLEARLQSLDSSTRGEIEAFIYNIYNLIFTQHEGDPVAPQLERCARYGKLVADLRAIVPDAMTALPLREFEESLAKIDAKLQVAQEKIAGAQGVEVEPLPYLDEKERGRAGELLEMQRKKLRGQTAGLKESLDDLRDAVIELSKPLQTLWLGASVQDTDQPERTERCRALLLQIAAIFEAAGVDIYQPRVGEEIDIRLVNYKFEGPVHEAPFIAAKVTKLGLRVEDRIEPGAVVVA